MGYELEREAPISVTSAAGIFAEGSRFGPYVIGPCIGHGDAGRLYRAEHEAIGCPLALEVLTGEFARSAAGRTRFMHEARRAAAVRHPSVVNVFDIGVHHGIPYLVMEYLEGEGLDVLLHSMGALDEGAIVDIMIPIVAGLAALHDIGIVHGGLETASVFLSQRGNRAREPKLLDFGISKSFGSQRFDQSGPFGLRGGFLYAAPETVRGGEPTPLSDQYSLGVIMYECMSGLNPFISDNRAEATRRIVHAEYLPLSGHPATLSPALGRIVDRAMSLDPAQRFADVKELGRELLALASERTRMTWSLSFGAAPSSSMDFTKALLHRRLPALLWRGLERARELLHTRERRAPASDVTAARGPSAADAANGPTTSIMVSRLGRPRLSLAARLGAENFNWASLLAVLFGLVTFGWGIAIILLRR